MPDINREAGATPRANARRNNGLTRGRWSCPNRRRMALPLPRLAALSETCRDLSVEAGQPPPVHCHTKPKPR